MLDLKFIRENLDAVRTNVRNRGVDVDPDRVVELYDRRNALLRELDERRAARNENAKRMKEKPSDDERQRLIEEGKRLKQEIPQLEDSLRGVENELYELAGKIPNMSHPDVPVGETDEDNAELKIIGAAPKFDFDPKDHVALALDLDLIDFETAAKVSGSKFYYLKNEAVLLELGLVRLALDIVAKHGFTMTVTPDVAKTDIVSGVGFNPRGAESNIYALEGEDACLIGTAEITLGGYHAGEILKREALPVKMAGLSHCFRREAGAAGQYSRGLYRVHQFTKVEMFVYCLPEESEKLHDAMLAIEEEIFQALEVSYRVVDTCTGDLGGPAYRKYDIEAWMPGRGENGGWGEVTSTSNCTDYQARRLACRYKSEDGNRFVHMLNGTAVATSRAIIAVLENHQQADGSVRIPKALQRYVGLEQIGPKSGAGDRAE